MTEAPQRHWDRVYSDKAPSEVSWFQSEPRTSLATRGATLDMRTDACVLQG